MNQAKRLKHVTREKQKENILSDRNDSIDVYKVFSIVANK